jgi:hypothetical protein
LLADIDDFAAAPAWRFALQPAQAAAMSRLIAD